MAHPYYSEKVFDQARHDSSLAVSHAMRSTGQHELSDRRNRSRISPVAELDTKLRNPQRRRVPLACGRCRRRKIKCSGDNGDGQACSNCRSASNTDCQFIRMNSMFMELQTKPCAWPYASPGGPLAPSPRVGMYAAHTPTKPTFLSMGSPQVRMSAYQRGAEYDVGAFDAQHGFARPAVGMDSCMHYDEEQPPSYTSQSPAYLLPGTPSGVMIDYGTSAWSHKACWNSALNGTKSSYAGLIPDPATSSSMSQPPFSYMLPSQGIPSTEFQSTNSPLVAVTSADIPGTDRTLPTPPTCRSQQQQGALAGMSTMPERLTSNGTLASSDFKSAFWTARCGTPADQQVTSSMPTVPTTDTYTSSPRPCPKSESSDDTPTNNDLVFAYLPMSTTTDDISLSLSTTAANIPSKTSATNRPYTGLNPLDNSATDYRTTTTTNNNNNTTNGQARLLSLSTDCTTDLYGYTSSEKNNKPRPASNTTEVRCSAAPPTLINGLPYTRVRHPEPATNSSSFAFGLMSAEAMPEYHRAALQNVNHVHLHRASVEPVGHHGGY